MKNNLDPNHEFGMMINYIARVVLGTDSESEK